MERALEAATWRGLRSVSLRYFNATGADAGGEIGEAHEPETHLLPLAVDAALGLRGALIVHGEDYPTQDGSCVRDFVHVSDLADAHLKAVQWLMRQKPGRGRHDVFNLGSGAGYSVKQVVQEIGRVGRPAGAACLRRAPAGGFAPTGGLHRQGAARSGMDAPARPRDADRGHGPLAPRDGPIRNIQAPRKRFSCGPEPVSGQDGPQEALVADDTRGPGNGLLYALLGALCVVVAGGGYYIYQNSQERPGGASARRPPRPRRAAPPAPAPLPPQQAAPAGPSASQLAQARAAITDARRMAARGDFAGAEMALQGADRVVPGFAETAAARREIADLASTRGDGRRDRAERRQDATRIAALVEAARAAIARRDYGAADRALDEAERIDARDPAVVRARNELLEAAARPARPPNRN